jgi:hypothetical protein
MVPANVIFLSHLEYVRASQHEEANFALVLFSLNTCSVSRVMKSVEGDVLMIPYTTQA